jgi:hypothetical protein
MRVLGLWLPATVPAGVTLAKGDGDALQWISPGYLLLLWAVVTAVRQKPPAKVGAFTPAPIASM